MQETMDFMKLVVEVFGVASAVAVPVAAYLRRRVGTIIREELSPIYKKIKKAERNQKIIAQGLFLSLHKDGKCEDNDCPCFRLERLAKQALALEDEDDDAD